MSITLFDPTPTCKEKDFFNYSQLAELPPVAYESIFEPTDEWWQEPDRLTFSIPSLNLAAICVRKFLSTRQTCNWFHLKVHAIAFLPFVQAMEEEKGATVLLPFWCWCDGGNLPQAHYRQHRHMIAVAPKGQFVERMFQKVTVAPKDRPFEEYKCFYCHSIKNVHHLINTIGYVSQQLSKCQMSATVETYLHHFYINITFPKKFKWVLACLWKKGLQHLLFQIYRYIPPQQLLTVAQYINDTWKICIKDVPHLPQNMVLPVSHEFFPTTEPTPYFLHLGKHRKLYFKKDERQLEPMEWGQVQARLGNCFCRNIENEWWTLPKEQKRFLNIHYISQPFQIRIHQLEKENAFLKSKLNLHTVKRKVDRKQESSQSRNVGCIDFLLSCV